MIRASKLTTKFSNKNKLEKLQTFVTQYKIVLQDFVNIIWNDMNDDFEVPKFISTKDYSRFGLSQRAIKCAATQASSIVRSNTTKLKKLIYIRNKLKQENKDLTTINKQIEFNKISKPTIGENIKCELNSICCDLKITKNYWYLQLKSIGKEFGKIRLLLKPHRQTLKWLKQGKILNSFLISENNIDVRIEIEDKEVKTNGKIVGLDQGISSCITLSDGQVSKDDIHGWNLSNIMSKLSRRKKGSKNFKKAQNQRKNYINWSINQLNLNNIKQINLEKIKDIRKGKSVDRYRSHWTYTLIKDKLIRICEEQKVFVKEQNCVYRSQRCNNCGLVRKNSRKGKLYNCISCGYVNDADLNASLNHEIELPDVEFMRCLSHNILGFYWRLDGIYDLNGKEFTVPSTS